MYNSPQFRKACPLDDDLTEIEMAKGKITHNIPISLGYFILQYAKLKMLEWYYDFLDTYVDRSDFAYLEMDTDSAYFALSTPSLEEAIKPELRQDFQNKINHSCHLDTIEPNPYWFPRECCEKHKALDRRTPGLFKLEGQGEEMF